MRLVLKIFAIALCVAPAPLRAETKIMIGSVPTIGDGGVICAKERGYFKAEGIDIELQAFRSAGDMVPLLVRGDLPVIAGGISAAFFNAVAQGLPIRYFVNRAGHPAYHAFMVRKDLADTIREPKDLKGRIIAVTGNGAVSEYETAKVLAAGHLTMDDVDARSLGMPQAAVALKNGAVDAGILVPPFDMVATRDAGAVAWVDPDKYISPPIEVAGYFFNTNWAAQNHDLVDRFMVAYLKGARCYLQAARHGPNRAEVIDMVMRYTAVQDRAVFEEMKWAELDPDGKIRIDSMLDQQEFFFSRGYMKQRVPAEQFVDDSFAKRALAVVGPYRE
jgi:NitT/TauT family transport system substrate-binding protein